jgi:hypothetical protein
MGASAAASGKVDASVPLSGAAASFVFAGATAPQEAVETQRAHEAKVRVFMLAKLAARRPARCAFRAFR